MNLKTLLVAATVAALPMSLSAALLDDFALDQAAAIDSAAGVGGDSNSIGSGGAYDWDTRTLFADLLSVDPQDPSGAFARLQVTGDRARFDSPTNATAAIGTVTYGFNSAYDLTASGSAIAFNLDPVSADQDFVFMLNVSDGTDTSSVTLGHGQISNGSLVISFASLVGSADLTMVEELSFSFSFDSSGATPNTTGLDWSVGEFTTAVPVPAGILLMGTAIAGFGVMRRRKKRA